MKNKATNLAVNLFVMVVLLAGGSVCSAMVTIESINVPSCEPCSCCEGTLSVTVNNTNPNSSVTVVVMIEYWACDGGLSTDCDDPESELGSPDSVMCREFTIDAATGTPGTEECEFENFSPTCDCPPLYEGGPHFLRAIVFICPDDEDQHDGLDCDITAPACDDFEIDTGCAQAQLYACEFFENDLCEYFGHQLVCCCDNC